MEIVESSEELKEISETVQKVIVKGSEELELRHDKAWMRFSRVELDKHRTLNLFVDTTSILKSS